LNLPEVKLTRQTCVDTNVGCILHLKAAWVTDEIYLFIRAKPIPKKETRIFNRWSS